jgi:hypothetical protein
MAALDTLLEVEGAVTGAAPGCRCRSVLYVELPHDPASRILWRTILRQSDIRATTCPSACMSNCRHIWHHRSAAPHLAAVRHTREQTPGPRLPGLWMTKSISGSLSLTCGCVGDRGPAAGADGGR